MSAFAASATDFEKASEFVKKAKSSSGKSASTEQKLKLYGFFKQTTGDVQGSQPWAVQMEARAKYDAWAANKGMSAEDAKTAYVSEVLSQIESLSLEAPGFGWPAKGGGGCCPPGALPYLATDYTQKGATATSNGCEFYAVGSGSTGKGLLVCPDVWGWNGGRNRAICDMLSEELGGALVLTPKLLDAPCFEGGTDGDALPPDFDIGSRYEEFGAWVKDFGITTAVGTKIDGALAELKSQGVKELGLVGFCYGGYTSCNAFLKAPEGVAVKAGVICHPSIHIAGMMGEDPVELAKKMTCPFLIMPSKDEEDAVYGEEGSIFKGLKSGCADTKSIPFPLMGHGWVPRGDMADAKTAEDVSLALKHMVEHFKKYLSV